MWYPATVTVAPTSEPIALEQAKAQCRVDGADEDATLASLISSARGQIEVTCGIALSTRTVTAKCDDFSDLYRLPLVPLQSVQSIAYVDTAGQPQQLTEGSFEVRADGLEAGIAINTGWRWPSILPGSRITVTATIGFQVIPVDLKYELLRCIGERFEDRGRTFAISDFVLANYRA